MTRDIKYNLTKNRKGKENLVNVFHKRTIRVNSTQYL